MASSVAMAIPIPTAMGFTALGTTTTDCHRRSGVSPIYGGFVVTTTATTTMTTTTIIIIFIIIIIKTALPWMQPWMQR